LAGLCDDGSAVPASGAQDCPATTPFQDGSSSSTNLVPIVVPVVVGVVLLAVVMTVVIAIRRRQATKTHVAHIAGNTQMTSV